MGKNILKKRLIEEVVEEAPLKEEEKEEKKKKEIRKENPLPTFQYPFLKKMALIGLFCFAIYLSLCFLSHIFFWTRDFDKLHAWTVWDVFTDTDFRVGNLGGRLGSYFSFLFINKAFGICSLLFTPIIAWWALYGLKRAKKAPKKFTFYGIFAILWASVFMGSFPLLPKLSILAGNFGYECSQYLEGLLGFFGLYIFLVFSLVVAIYSAFRNFRLTPSLSSKAITKDEPSKIEINETFRKPINNKEESEEEDTISSILQFEIKENKEAPKESHPTQTPDIKKTIQQEFVQHLEVEEKEVVKSEPMPVAKIQEEDGIEFTIEKKAQETPLSKEDIQARRIHNTIDTPYDPSLDLPSFRFPGTDLLPEIKGQSISSEILNEELLANKKRIVDTLKNYSIEISQIKATIGPTVTLYEIVPAAGVRIAKIKNLEDDIALTLSALGIRIIAPIPGKGTIGIEVPNQTKQVVPMKTMLESEKFINSSFDLPIALGKTISDECFVADLSKMPHLLMAGATGQGKSVGLNAIIGSLLYKKHPSELKFVMVDPKKVELSLFNKIERHYLAKLPDSDEAIITDTQKVVRTLNSLCVEMDQRYDLLKDAQVRNLKEYNQKFIARKLNPEEGHRFLPYIVLIIDEFADLIMTAGKEVELPIARLAQLARAIGIHLVIATQRPSVNVITGTIKANFPARIAFRVTSKIDSRTILDSSGADQLIGRGDMLLSTGNELIRLQCAFIDTPEIEKITDFIGAQRGYPSAYHLPECPEEGNEAGGRDFSEEERDALFEEAAHLIVSTQQGSTSLLQRKLKLGYNRAGRLIDQLEAAGIVGPFEGSKSREVRIKDIISLEQILSNSHENFE